jgi:hypothetical protein
MTELNLNIKALESLLKAKGDDSSEEDDEVYFAFCLKIMLKYKKNCKIVFIFLSILESQLRI